MIEEFGSSNGNIAKPFAVKNGELVPITFEHDAEGIFTGTRLRSSGPGKYQYMFSDNSTGTYHLNEVQLNQEGTTLSVIGNAEVDASFFDQFTSDPSYFYTP